ncbi:MAG: hypothetical protein R2764_02550 [Bacteroidales bacterium]
MKQILTLLLLAINLAIFAQNFKPFNSTTKKLFSTYPEQHNTYSMSFDSAAVLEGDSVYYNFYRIDSLNFISYDCDFGLDQNVINKTSLFRLVRKLSSTIFSHTTSSK